LQIACSNQAKIPRTIEKLFKIDIGAKEFEGRSLVIGGEKRQSKSEMD
jgi:hypothetical protein